MIFPLDSTARSWVTSAAGNLFPLQNLPYGVFSVATQGPRLGVAIGYEVLDLAVLADAGLLGDVVDVRSDAFSAESLHPLLRAGQPAWRSLRRRLIALLAADDVITLASGPLDADRRLRDDAPLRDRAFQRASAVTMHQPIHPRNFVDFYASREHASNVGAMFRDPKNPLLPNWTHLPVGYHGRAGTVVGSGTPIIRPQGQTRPDPDAPPVFGPTKALDFELEMGFITGDGPSLGESIPIDEAADHIFGMVVVNDWSARDIQKWEYVPLGPFLGKSFATSIGCWVTPLDALAPFRVSPPPQDPQPLPYLQTNEPWGLNVDLEAELAPFGVEHPMTLTRTSFRYMYWTIVQQLAHATVNGATICAGDLYASGTISGPTPDSYGCLLELCRQGTRPIMLPDGTQRVYLADGDALTLRARCVAEHFQVGFGEVVGKVLPARLRWKDESPDACG